MRMGNGKKIILDLGDVYYLYICILMLNLEMKEIQDEYHIMEM
jgi:hypothetical protein